MRPDCLGRIVTSMAKREELISKAREIAEKLGKTTLSAREFTEASGISANQIFKYFDGWRDLSEHAGLIPDRTKVRLSDEEIFSAMRDAFLKIGGISTRAKFSKNFRYSADVLKKRGFDWRSALLAFREWAEENDPNFSFMEQLPSDQLELSSIPVDDATVDHTGTDNAIGIPPRSPYAYARLNGIPTYGDPIDFRGLRHEPVNEQGVVFLFGMVARELGYMVEAVQTGYPDCEAKRQIGPGKWQRVRIEFEYQSRNFHSHGHNPAGCDLVVCWEHNWPDCPVEVLDLKSAIKNLR